jgi:tripartite-type tricarboxylate transporter receptor subunit TctC
MVSRLLMTLLLGVAPAIAWAQAFPNKQVRFISPYPPGGVTDLAARLTGAKLSEMWKQPVIVDNRTGGGGTIGMDAGAKAAADGHTLLFATVADLCIIPYGYANLPYSVARDFAPVIMATDTPLVWAAHRDAPFNTLRELVAHSKSTSGGVSYSSPALGSLNHVVAEQFAALTGANLVHIPYKGGGPAATALASGEVPLGMLAVSSVAPHAKSGRVKALAVSAERRSILGPDWPTMAEAGVAGVTGSQWVAVLAPGSTPRALIERINADFIEVLKGVDIRERLAAVGSEPVGSTPEAVTIRIRQNTEEYRRVVERLKLKLD